MELPLEQKVGTGSSHKDLSKQGQSELFASRYSGFFDSMPNLLSALSQKPRHFNHFSEELAQRYLENLPAGDEIVVREAVRSAKVYNPKVEVFAFGSSLRGKYNDLDLLFVFPESGSANPYQRETQPFNIPKIMDLPARIVRAVTPWINLRGGENSESGMEIVSDVRIVPALQKVDFQVSYPINNIITDMPLHINVTDSQKTLSVLMNYELNRREMTKTDLSTPLVIKL
ncbi:MAG: nucleotidyltransferase domain-containing protein [Candidatus Nanoarchaeia archaeon]